MSPHVPRQHTVVILKRGDKAIVWPPYLVVWPEDYVTFSTVGVSAKIEFPNSAAFMGADKNHQPTSEKPSWKAVVESATGIEGVIRMKKDETYRVRLADGEVAMASYRVGREETPEKGKNIIFGNNTQVYAYSVFCEEINDFAEGNSSPVMIIEPPPVGGG